MCRSRRELSNAYFVAKFVLDTAGNEPCQVCPTEPFPDPGHALEPRRRRLAAEEQAVLADDEGAAVPRQPAHELLALNVLRDHANFTGLVLGCIEAKFCK